MSNDLTPDLIELADTKLSPEILESIITRIFNSNSDRESIALSSDRGVQTHFAKSYQSRFFLELLQNSRDAIVLGGVKKGMVKAWIEDNVFCFANNGAEFNEHGIKSICYPAISTKSDKGMIGHKGIGFNSILEITDHPALVTNYGTMYFSNEAAAGQINDETKPANLLPLFQLPLFEGATLSENYPELFHEGFTTVFKFPLDKRTDTTSVIKQAKELTAQDVIFLTHIKQLSIAGELKAIIATSPLILFEDNQEIRRFKQYEHPFKFTQDIVDDFLEDESAQFKTDLSVECKFLLELDEQGKFIPASNAKLYLYYALEPVTGLSFGIHSFFSVSIDRKTLTGKSPLNDELFKELAQYYCNHFLTAIKEDHPDSVLEILAYVRKDNAGLTGFYDLLKEKLKGKAFIYHKLAGKYLTADEVLLVTKEESNLFKNGELGGKYLFQAPNSLLETWLTKEANVGVLNNAFVLDHIEIKCEENIADPRFFQALYNLNKTWKIDFITKKILLTENGILKAGKDTDVFFLSRAEYSTPAILEQSLAFLKTGLKVDDFNEQQRKQLGLTEYSAERLLSAALKLYKEVRFETPEQELIEIEIIRFLKRLNPDIKGRIKDDVLFPVIHKATGVRSWKNLMQTPVYFPSFEFASAYSDDFYHIDWELLNADQDIIGWQLFLEQIGVWAIPGAYLVPKKKESADGDGYIENDREFHQPVAAISHRFGQSIISNWSKYREFILCQDPLNKALKIPGVHDDSLKVRQSGLIYYLKTSSWMPVTVKELPVLRMPGEVIAVSPDDYQRIQNQILFEFMDIIKHDHAFHGQILSDLDICHFSVLTLENYKRILLWVQTMYADLAIDSLKKGNFEKFFNRILSYLHDYLQSKPKENTEYLSFKDAFFLSKSLNDPSLHWSLGKDTIHVDNKTFLDRMSGNGITTHLKDPFAFTKRDRGEWGKYAVRIGRPLTKIIKTVIVSEGRLTGLIEIADNLEIVIAFVEDDQGQNFSDKAIESLKEGNVKIHHHLDIKANVEGLDLSLPHDFYVEGEGDDTILHLDRRLLSGDRKPLASALASFFEQFTKSEMKRLDLMIEDTLYLHDILTKYEYAVKRNIDQNRLDEIAEILAKGSSMPQRPANVETPVGRVITAAPAVTTKVTKIQTEKELVEVTVTDGHEAFLEHLRGAVNQPVTGFTGSFATPVFGHRTPRPIENSSGGYRLSREYSEKSLKDIGFYGEYYVYNKFIEKDRDLLKYVGLDNSEAFDLEWFNEHRIKNKELQDRSTGMGCDMQITDKHIFIEVKTMKSDSDTFHLTEKEFSRMKIAGDQYFLIFVKHIYDPAIIETYVISNPYQRFIMGEIRFIEAKLNSPC
jgi:hypothetical protein